MYRFVVDLLEPYPLLFLVVGLALANLWRRRKETRRRLLLLTLPYLLLCLGSLPVVGFLALRTLEGGYPPTTGRPADVEALVVLTAGMSAPNDARPEPELDYDSLLRCLHTAKLYRDGPPLPVVVSGGKVDDATPGPACADVMADLLERLGIRRADLIVENGSRNTYENASASATLLKERGLTRVALVADAVDMYRAERCFRKQGIGIAPAACHHRATKFQWSVFEFLPHPSAARTCERVGHEWLGVLWYWVRGRI